MTKYKIRLLYDEESERTKYEIFVGCCKESSKEITGTERLQRYFEIQRATGRQIERVIVSGINGQVVEAGELEVELNERFVNTSHE